jgi:hypothetical protein
MTEYQIKLAGALPKGDPNGFADPVLAEELARTVVEARAFQPRVAVIVYDAKSATVGTDGEVTVTVRVRRLQPVASMTNRRAIEQVLLSEYREQTGAHVLPFDLESVTKAAFVDLPKTNEEIDAQEADEQDHMSPTDELRRHLERVHGVPEAHLLTPEAAEAKHEAEHAGDMPDVLAHDREWLGWTRADLEAAQAESDGDDPDAAEDSVIVSSDDEEDAEQGVLHVDFSGSRG